MLKWIEVIGKWCKERFLPATPVTEVAPAEKEERFDYYHPGERILFRYWDGQKEVIIDPVPLYRRMMQSRADLLFDGDKVIESIETDSVAFCKHLDKVRELFNVKSHEHGGLTEIETNHLFAHFVLYCRGVTGLPLGEAPKSPEQKEEIKTSGVPRDDPITPTMPQPPQKSGSAVVSAVS